MRRQKASRPWLLIRPVWSKQIERIAAGRQMMPQISAGSIADAEFFDEGGIAQSALLQILDRFGMAMELELIESGGLRQQLSVGRGAGWRNFLLQVAQRFGGTRDLARVRQSGSDRRRGRSRGSRTDSCGH